MMQKTKGKWSHFSIKWSLTHLRITAAVKWRKEKRETHSVWGPECRGTAAEHPERLAVWPLRASRMTQNPSHPPPPTHHTSANKYTPQRWYCSADAENGLGLSTDASKARNMKYAVRIFKLYCNVAWHEGIIPAGSNKLSISGQHNNSQFYWQNFRFYSYIFWLIWFLYLSVMLQRSPAPMGLQDTLSQKHKQWSKIQVEYNQDTKQMYSNSDVQ